MSKDRKRGSPTAILSPGSFDLRCDSLSEPNCANSTNHKQTTVVQMLLGLINLGSSSAFLAFVSVGVISLAVSYGIPIAISLFHGRKDVNGARWTMGSTVGWVVNIIALLWIIFEMILFSMPTVLPVTEVTMNYAIVVFFGFMAISASWYAVHARKGETID